MTRHDVDLAKVHRLFYPQIPVVVTVETWERIGAMPAISCMPLSFNPPLIGISLSPEHETYKMIVEARAFAVNWLDYSHVHQVAELGEFSGREHTEKLVQVGLTTTKLHASSQPLIQEAVAVLECRVQQENRIGTHSLVIAQVMRASAAEYFRGY